MPVPLPQPMLPTDIECRMRTRLVTNVSIMSTFSTLDNISPGNYSISRVLRITTLVSGISASDINIPHNRGEPTSQRRVADYVLLCLDMLHIEIEERAGTNLLLTLKGEITGASSAELMTRWKESGRVCSGKICIVDFSSVAAMDESGELAIRVLAHDGVRFLARGPMLGRIIDLVCEASVEAAQAGSAGFRSIVFNS